ncbi:MAG TPA: hypothetical protein VEA59_06275, partial [Patescibacteria group bacterium]|nr:hypothetical protein [Patescibacteria group bacterium]
MNKKLGQTPLEALNKLKRRHPNGRFTYAGRLDPAAEGMLLVLSGDAIHDKASFLALPKTYTAKVVFGISTDSGDLLGVPKTSKHTSTLTRTQVLHALNDFLGTTTLPLPAFSSPPLRGKPLWELKKTGQLTSRDLPKRNMEIIRLRLVTMEEVLGEHIRKRALKLARIVNGDFRQE